MKTNSARNPARHFLQRHYYLIRIGIILIAIVFALVFGLFVLIPMFRNLCWINKTNCTTIKVQRKDNGELLVRSNSTGFTYWYDGKYIYAFGDIIQGTCPQKVAVGIDPDKIPSQVPIPGTSKVPPEEGCLHIDDQGQCMSRVCAEWKNEECTKWNDNRNMVDPSKAYIPKNEEEMQASKFKGTIAFKGNIFEPTFTMDASTMEMIPSQYTCVKKLEFVLPSFEGHKTYKLKAKLSDKVPLNVVQIFKYLKDKKIFQPS